MDLKDFENKKIKLILLGTNQNELTYTGVLLEVGTDLFRFKDKYDNLIVANKNRILEIKLINGGSKR